MKLGKIKFFLFFLFFSNLLAEEKIFSTPIINLENLEPSYESSDNENEIEEIKDLQLRERISQKENTTNFKFINLIGLDKITAKTKKIKIEIGQTAKFGLLEIKALKCGVSKTNQQSGSVAYIQVRDTSESENEKVFIFNGWTFSDSPSLTPIDHAVYDVWLVDCESV